MTRLLWNTSVRTIFVFVGLVLGGAPQGVDALTNFSCERNDVTALRLGEARVCMGALLENGRFTLTTGNCAMKMETEYKKRGRAPKVVYGDRSANVRCMSLHMESIALVQTYQPLEGSAAYSVPTKDVAPGDECNIVFDSSAESDQLMDLKVTVKNHSSDCKVQDETKLCVAVARQDGLPQLNISDAEGAALVCGAGSLQGLLVGDAGAGARLEGGQGELALTNVHFYARWIQDAANITAREATCISPEDDPDTTAQPTTAVPTHSPATVTVPEPALTTTAVPSPATVTVPKPALTTTAVPTPSPGTSTPSGGAPAGGCLHRARGLDLGLGLVLVVRCALSAYQ